MISLVAAEQAWNKLAHLLTGELPKELAGSDSVAKRERERAQSWFLKTQRTLSMVIDHGHLPAAELPRLTRCVAYFNAMRRYILHFGE